MLFADAALACRLEAAEAANARGCTAMYPEASSLEVAGGCAVFAGADSPLTNAVGIGLKGRVSEADLDAMEAFFQSRGAPVIVDLCPLADAGLLEALSRRGYHATDFNTVLVKRLAGVEIALTPRVRRALPDEGDLWSYTVGRGFFEQTHVTTEEMNVGRAIFAMPGVMCYLASIELGQAAAECGDAAAGGASAIHDGLATLFADSTIAGFRRQGLHRELIVARLNDAVAQRCDLATASTQPGAISQRNYERMGFEVVYTKITLMKEAG